MHTPSTTLKRKRIHRRERKNVRKTRHLPCVSASSEVGKPVKVVRFGFGVFTVFGCLFSVLLRFSDFGFRWFSDFGISEISDSGRNQVSQAETGSLRPKPGLSEDSWVTRGFRFAISVFGFCHVGVRCLEISENI